MPPHTKTLLRERRVLAAFEAGHTVAQIGAAEGLRRTQVGRILKKHGIPYPGSRTPLDPAITARLTDATWLAAEYASKSAAQIARELGVTQPRVRAALERAGIPRRRPSEYTALAFGVKWPAEQQEQAVALYRGGLSARAVARELGLPRQWVFRLLARRGLTRTLQEARALKQAQKRECNPAL